MNNSRHLNKYSALDYMERYVNDGSPSGFTIEKQLRGATNPYSNTHSFHLLEIDDRSFQKTEILGNIHPQFISNSFLLHPMMRDRFADIGGNLRPSRIQVSPTSSGRTVVSQGKSRHYLKLHFNAILGRIDRSISHQKAVAGVEMGSLLKRGLENERINSHVGLLRETGAKVGWISAQESCAFIYRETEPWFHTSPEITWLVPFFSLISKDHKSSQNINSLEVRLLLRKIIGGLKSDEDATFEKIIKPCIDLYFAGVKMLGAQIEFNAQNILIGFDEDYKPVGVILRDFSGIEKDFGFTSEYWPSKFESEPYKCIYPADDHYQIRHSFAFDFKLSKYVIEPLLSLMAHSADTLNENLMARSIDLTAEWVKQMPSDFFPSECWYSHPIQLLTESRPYIKSTNPLLRPEA